MSFRNSIIDNEQTEQNVCFAYVGSRTTKERNARGEGINVYRVNLESGSWTHVQLVRDVNPSFLAFDQNRNFLYTVHGDGTQVSAFKINKQTGKLTLLNRQSTHGKNPVHLVVDATNQFLVVANYISGDLAVFPIDVDGSLKEICNHVKIPGEAISDNVYDKQGIPHPHQVVLDPAGNFFVVPDLGWVQ